MESPLVLDCGVVGAPDEAFGERAVAFVVPHPRTSLNQEMLLRALETHCALRLGRLKRPAELRIVDAVPRSPTGKLLRRELRSSLSGDISGQAL
jgi:acyl-CoA synthetase (AMP-forming)/AMP-acid ligase II